MPIRDLLIRAGKPQHGGLCSDYWLD